MKSGIVSAAVVSVIAIAGSAQANIVFSNSGAPGDAFMNAGPTTTGQALGASGWYYNNVRNSGVVGANVQYPRSGNGSVRMQTLFGPGGASSKADIEFFATAAANGAGNYGATSAITSLGNLGALSYEWYRASSSSNSVIQHPVIRVGVFDPQTNANGYLIFEREYNGGNGAAAPVDQWISEDIFGSNYRLWASGSTLPNNINGTMGPIQLYDARTIGDWRTQFPHYLVTTISLGVGSGWGPFDGAIDNVRYSIIGGPEFVDNFEVVPAPGAAALLGLGGLAALRRRRA
ncbi:MAG: hypothetical protein AB7K52_10715 [Phycisphaerales bacterium]